MEYQSGQVIEEYSGQRGRPLTEARLPNLREDIRSIVEPSGQADPTFRSTRIYSPLSANEVRERLFAQYGYTDTELPCTRTLRTKLNDLGVAEIIKYPKIARDFGSDSRRGKGRIVVLCNLFHNAEKSVWNRFSRQPEG